MEQGLFIMDYNIKLIADKIASCKGIVYTCGNGGSSSTASHFTQDLIKACQIRSICLTDNVPYLTAVSNDDDYDNVFSSYLKLFWRKGDLLFLISGSGNSRNVINAADAMRDAIETIALVGFDGGQLKYCVDYCIHSAIHDMRKAEDEHMKIIHQIIESITNGTV